MPNQLYRCRHFGCMELVTVSNGYCSAHAPFKTRPQERRGGSTERGYTYKWQQARRYYLRENPICRECGHPATDVDHIIPHKGDMTLFWNKANWQPLCHQCHSRKTLQELSSKLPESI